MHINIKDLFTILALNSHPVTKYAYLATRAVRKPSARWRASSTTPCWCEGRMDTTCTRGMTCIEEKRVL